MKRTTPRDRIERIRAAGRRIPILESPTGVAALALSILTLLGLPSAGPARASFNGFTPSPGGGDPVSEADGRSTPTPTILAYPLRDGETIEIDGRLDEPSWLAAQPGTGFRCWDPDRGSLPSEETVFKVVYDTDAIYFAVACIEKDPCRITKKLSRRDRFSNSDLVSIYVDPYYDKSTGYNFRVNPLGVQQDSYLFDDGNMDSNWDAVWESETCEDEDGWYAEVRIPFSSIRYRDGAPTWGLQIYRYMHGRGEDTAWVVWDRETSGFVSRFGRLTGLKDVPPPRQLEILPYGVYRATDPSTTGSEDFESLQNLGADLKYGITADLTLNAAFQPDFGQVEADPAELNLSPFETFFQEKRPLFIEGNRFFQHQGFNLFYSRRIGTGDENARIRYAAKLTGKTAGDLSIGALVAATDVTGAGQVHNFLREGSRPSHYLVGRLGKEYAEGRYRFNVMQTAVANSASREEYGDRASREAYTSGIDLNLLFGDRAYEIEGSFVGSLIDHESLADDPDVGPSRSYGTGGTFEFNRIGGSLKGGIYGRWESDDLELNDIGFLQSPDEIGTGGWLSYHYTPDGTSELLNRGEANLNLNRTWLYGSRTGYDLATGEKVWSYAKGHAQLASANINSWMQFRNFYEMWFGINYNARGAQRYETRSTVSLLDGGDESIPGGGPLITEPATYGGWMGGNTDSRKDLVFRLGGNYWVDTAHNRSISAEAGCRWNQSSAVQHELEISFQERTDDTQHLGNFENPGEGIGDVSYVFGEIHQQTADIALRTSLLFGRDRSLEVYAQPFLTVGDYTNARELVRPDSYDLEPYSAGGFQVEDYDFSFSAVNLNVVYRWEYRPGSTIFIVWTHSRQSYDERGEFHGSGEFHNNLNGRDLFDNESENVFLAKVTYWIPV